MIVEGNLTIEHISTEWEISNKHGEKIRVKMCAGGMLDIYPIRGGARCVDMSDGGFVFKNSDAERAERIGELIKRAATLPRLTD